MLYNPPNWDWMANSYTKLNISRSNTINLAKTKCWSSSVSFFSCFWSSNLLELWRQVRKLATNVCITNQTTQNFKTPNSVLLSMDKILSVERYGSLNILLIWLIHLANPFKKICKSTIVNWIYEICSNFIQYVQNHMEGVLYILHKAKKEFWISRFKWNKDSQYSTQVSILLVSIKIPINFQRIFFSL